MVRKLSFAMQLSDPDDYEGGNVQLLDEAGNSYIVPRKRGTIVLFDSRTQHRVLKVTKGTRKSIVGWTVTPVGSEVEYDRTGSYESGEAEHWNCPTRNESFEKNGYLVIKDLWDVDELYSPVPKLTGQYNYWDKNPENFNHTPVEQQVQGSTARYWHPQYRTIHTGIRLKLEEAIGRKLYNTYYYDRFYYPGQRTDTSC